MIRILSRTEMSSLLSIEDVIAAVENGFRQCAGGDYHIPVRLPLEVPKQDAVVLFMPGYLPFADILGAKVVSVFPGNTERGLPIIIGSYMLCDAETGNLLALMDATYMTGIRTAATSAVATKYLARKDAHTLGIFGAGVQARAHIHALCAVRDVQDVIIYNRTQQHGENMAGEISSQVPSVRTVSDPNECLRNADIIATCTRSSHPLFDGRRLRPGTHINAVGAFTPTMREVDTETVRRSKIIVDTYIGALAEAGDLLIPIQEGRMTKDHLHAELGEVVAGMKPGRTSDHEITLFKSVGFAMEDAVTARLAYDRAVAQNIGTMVEL